jgi:para-nitrobenzyl esterase
MSAGIVKTATGAVRGRLEGGVWAFKGIPYGADTSGGGRFRPALPPEPWPGVRDCFEYGPSCPQVSYEQLIGQPFRPEAESMMGVLGHERVTGEDCLALNVWTPSLDETARLPVLVWLHGGGWSIGSASAPLYDFSNLCRNNGVVTIGINHRIGILGFLDVSRLDDRFADSGNVGLLDVITALRWVDEHISAFGGDPGNVTVFGESGGGAKTSTLLAMPEGRGLFHKAFMMSGAMPQAQTPDAAWSKTAHVLGQLGIESDWPALQAVPVGRLIEAAAGVPGTAGGAVKGSEAFSPVIGPSLPGHPHDLIRAGNAREVTTVSGCTTDEILAFMLFDPDLWILGIDAVVERLEPALGDQAQKVVSDYQAIRPDDSPSSLLIAIATDIKFRIPHIRMTEAKIEAGGSPAYVYAFGWGFPDPTGVIRSVHGTDMPYFFDNLEKAPAAAGPHAEELVKVMSGSLAAFAHTGSPNHQALPLWPAYTLDRRATMCFDAAPAVADDPLGAERGCWRGITLNGLGGA